MSPLYQRELVHRALPWPVVRPALREWATRVWDRDASVRDHARWEMRYLVGDGLSTGALDDLARRYVQAVYARQEGWYRPWLTTRRPPRGITQLAELARGGRGVILNFAHHADFHGPIGALAGAGVPVHTVLDGRFFDERRGPIERQIVRTLTCRGGEVLPARGSRAEIHSLLAQGKVVALASDVPGRTPVRLLDRTVGLADGAARIALETGAVVVPLTARRTSRGQVAELGDLIEPERFSGAAELLAEMVRRHEVAWAAWPEAVERPLRRSAPLGDDAEVFGWAAGSELAI